MVSLLDIALIYVNQSDVNERNVQVRNMKDVYLMRKPPRCGLG